MKTEFSGTAAVLKIFPTERLTLTLLKLNFISAEANLKFTRNITAGRQKAAVHGKSLLPKSVFRQEAYEAPSVPLLLRQFGSFKPAEA